MGRREREERADSAEYLARRREFRRLMTICGRNPVIEALSRPDVQVVRLHLAEGCRGEAVDRILRLARDRGAEVRRVPAQRVSQISGSSRQDQGVAADVRAPNYGLAEDYLANAPERFALLALDGVTTPRNVGMAIRSVAAGGADGLILPEQGCCGIIPLVVKSSAGAVFAARILRCESLAPVLEQCAELGAEVCVLDPRTKESLFDREPTEREVYVLGGEAEGVSGPVRRVATRSLRIPMAAGVESLNVAVAAALVAYRRLLAGPRNGSG
jgi:23S rRNA (guanosine2251-2'-O)-methyltransferase